MSDTDALTGATNAAQRWLDEHTDGAFARAGDPPGRLAQALAQAVLDGAGFGAAATQSMPTPTDLPDGAHDRAIEWLSTAAHFRIGRERGDVQLVIAGLAGRKAFGLRKYGTTLNPANGRDVTLDVLDEVLDGIAYAQIGIDEALQGNDGRGYSFWWQRRSRLVDEAIALSVRQMEISGWQRTVDVEHEGDEAALAVTADASSA